MRKLQLALVGFMTLACSVNSYGQASKDDGKKIDLDKIVGTWKPTRGTMPANSAVEFTKDGVMHVTVHEDGNKTVYSHDYKISGNLLHTTNKQGKHTGPDRHIKHAVTIVSLSDRTIEIRDDKGKETTLTRNR